MNLHVIPGPRGRPVLQMQAYMRDCSNLLRPGVLSIFGPRPGETRPAEQWKLDLHTPKCLRDQDRILAAADAADAAGIYLRILQAYLGTCSLTLAASASAGSVIDLPVHVTT